jgi:hypothetical protein
MPPPSTPALLPLMVTLASLTSLLTWTAPSTARAPPCTSAALAENVLRVTTAVPLSWNRAPPLSAVLSLRLVLRMVTVSPCW